MPMITSAAPSRHLFFMRSSCRGHRAAPRRHRPAGNPSELGFYVILRQNAVPFCHVRSDWGSTASRSPSNNPLIGLPKRHIVGLTYGHDLPRSTYGGGYHTAPSFPDTPIYDSLVAERARLRSPRSECPPPTTPAAASPPVEAAPTYRRSPRRCPPSRRRPPRSPPPPTTAVTATRSPRRRWPRTPAAGSGPVHPAAAVRPARLPGRPVPAAAAPPGRRRLRGDASGGAPARPGTGPGPYADPYNRPYQGGSY